MLTISALYTPLNLKSSSCDNSIQFKMQFRHVHNPALDMPQLVVSNLLPTL